MFIKWYGLNQGCSATKKNSPWWKLDGPLRCRLFQNYRCSLFSLCVIPEVHECLSSNGQTFELELKALLTFVSQRIYGKQITRRQSQWRTKVPKFFFFLFPPSVFHHQCIYELLEVIPKLRPSCHYNLLCALDCLKYESKTGANEIFGADSICLTHTSLQTQSIDLLTMSVIRYHWLLLPIKSIIWSDTAFAYFWVNCAI